MTSVVYFLYNPATKLIKIGTTTNYYARLSELQGQQESRLELLGLLEGDIVIEAAIHLRFAIIRVPRKRYGGQLEWFYDTPELREYIAQTAHLSPPSRPGRRVAVPKQPMVNLRLDTEVAERLKIAKWLFGFSTLSDTIHWLIENHYPEVIEKLRSGQTG